MRTRHPSSVALLFALVLAVPGCRSSGGVAKGVQVDAQTPAEKPVPLPNKDDSFKFGVIGDFGTGDRTQYELADQMAKFREHFKYNLVIMVGDNLYGAERPQDFKKKFEDPYKALLDDGVKFYGCLGNHDSREQRYYKLFNMEGKLYYTFNPAPEVRVFVLESTYLEPEQVKWFEDELKASSSNWKIAFFHHPIYSSARRHGSDLRLREVLEPLLINYNVSVVFTGHDHVYERLKTQHGIVHFVVGSGGKLREGDIDKASEIIAKGFDTDLAFLVAEITGDEMYFQVISRVGRIVDSGVVTRRTLVP